MVVETVFTGEDTRTGGRIHLARERLGGGTFCATYADGVADLDLPELVGFHREHGDLATMTVVRPELQFGITDLAGEGHLRAFRHTGFWECMDTLKDAVALNDLGTVARPGTCGSERGPAHPGGGTTWPRPGSPRRPRPAARVHG